MLPNDTYTRLVRLEDLVLGTPTVKFKKLNPRATLPKYMTDEASGMDLFACVEFAFSLNPGESFLVGTGLAIELPLGYEAQVRPRSGLAAKHGITVLNSPGTIDSDFLNTELKVLVVNHSQRPYKIEPNCRIAQLVVAKTTKVNVVETQETRTSNRLGGFGSTKGF